MKSYIYAIVNSVNGKRYIGSTNDLAKRFSRHKKTLERGEHHSVYLQRAYNFYGKSSFSFEILEECPSENVLKREQEYLDVRAEYNMAKTSVAVMAGRHHTEEARRKIGDASRGKNRLSEEGRQRLRNFRASFGFSDADRKKMSDAHKGKPSPKKGKPGTPLTEERKRKMSEFFKGRTSPMKGRKQSEEAKNKMSASRKGIKLSEERRQKIRDGWQKRKATANA